MLPDFLRGAARQIARDRKVIKLAVFGPGKGSQFFEKRTAIYEAIKREHSDVNIDFYMIDEREPPTKDYEDYIARVRPVEIEQIEWADIILFLFTHHRLSAFVELILVQDHERKTGQLLFDKCALAVLDSLETSSLWHHEAKYFCRGCSERFHQFENTDLISCRVASDIALELFQRVVLERWFIK